MDYARRQKIEAVAGKILAGDRREVGDGRGKGLEGEGGVASAGGGDVLWRTVDVRAANHPCRAFLRVRLRLLRAV